MRAMLYAAQGLELDYFTLPHTSVFNEPEIPYVDDADFITFHKGPEPPYICHQIKICGFETSKEPFYLDWYYTINTHG